MAEAGQHKGKEKKNTLILEAICDPDTYIWYCFFGEPGSLNDLNDSGEVNNCWVYFEWNDGPSITTRITLLY